MIFLFLLYLDWYLAIYLVQLNFLVHYHIILLAGNHLKNFLIRSLWFQLLHGLQKVALHLQTIEREHWEIYDPRNLLCQLWCQLDCYDTTHLLPHDVKFSLITDPFFNKFFQVLHNFLEPGHRRIVRRVPKTSHTGSYTSIAFFLAQFLHDFFNRSRAHKICV